MIVQTTNRRHLKDLSRDAHARAEQIWTGADGFTDRDQYLRWLGVLQTAHDRLGLPAAQALDESGFVVEEQARLSALAKDRASQPRVWLAPGSAMSKDYAWGVLYALNGSALGASVLFKQLQPRHDWPREYLATMRGYGVSGRLKSFFDRLDDTPLDLIRAASGASDVFGLFMERPDARSVFAAT